MKNIFKILLGFTMLSTMAYGFEFKLYPKTLNQYTNGNTLIDFINLRDIDQETLVKIMDGSAPNLALEINENESIPLNLFLKGDFFELMIPRNTKLVIQTKQNLYFRNDWGNFLFSTNGSDWKPLNEAMTGAVTMMIDLEPLSLTLGAEIIEAPSKENS